jgi:NAD+ synthase (glutamine-hydrolysing)
MKIALAQINTLIGHFEYNVNKIVAYIQKAKKQGADILVFPELCLCGYPPRDFLEFQPFIKKCTESIEDIRKYCNDIAVIIGAPSPNTEKLGKRLYNSAYFIADNKIQSVIHKSLLPDYDVFDEYRYFEPGKEHHVITYKNKRIALTICEDLWNLNTSFYIKNPMDALITQKPDCIINIAASPFSYDQNQARLDVLFNNAKKYGIPLFYCNHSGSQTELIFDGGSAVVNSQGILVDQMEFFSENIKSYELDTIEDVKKAFQAVTEKYDLINQALICGIRNYFDKLNFKKAILGLSGGIDSALALVLSVQALGKENVHCLLMPSLYSSEHSVKDAIQLANNVGVTYDIIEISELFHTYCHLLKPYFKELPFDISEENLQSRIRGMLLMAFCNKFSYILINTSNKSELAVGYGTLYGDMAGGLSVIGDLYKIEVYGLSQYINRNKEIIPENIIAKEPSAELKPDQKDSDSLPPYPVLDTILFHYIEERKTAEEIIAKGFDKSMIIKVMRMVNTNEYKRYQAAPVLRVSQKAFGYGRRMPIVANFDF